MTTLAANLMSARETYPMLLSPDFLLSPVVLSAIGGLYLAIKGWKKCKGLIADAAEFFAAIKAAWTFFTDQILPLIKAQLAKQQQPAPAPQSVDLKPAQPSNPPAT